MKSLILRTCERINNFWWKTDLIISLAEREVPPILSCMSLVLLWPASSRNACLSLNSNKVVTLIDSWSCFFCCWDLVWWPSSSGLAAKLKTRLGSYTLWERSGLGRRLFGMKMPGLWATKFISDVPCFPPCTARYSFVWF